MTPEIHAARRDRLRPLIQESGLGALLVNYAANRFYLSGFELHDPQCNETSGWLLVTAYGPDWLLTDGRFTDAAGRLFPPEHVFTYRPPRLASVREFIKKLDLGPIGFQPCALSVSDHQELTKDLDMVAAPRLVEKLRVIKEPGEVERMRASCALNHAVFAQTPDLLVPGKTEAQVAWELEKAFRDQGAEELSFASIVGVGPNAALPHAIPGRDVVREGDLVLVDMGCRLNDYCSDQTRTFWVGGMPSARFEDTMAMVRQAQDKAIDAMGPGMSFAEAYRVAREHFESLGVENMFTHGLGHGIGLETHEPPSLSPRASGELQPGMIVTVEPGLYDAAWGGIRWEYMVLITDNGTEIL